MVVALSLLPAICIRLETLLGFSRGDLSSAADCSILLEMLNLALFEATGPDP